MNWNNLLPYTPAIISLLKGVVKTSDKTWDVLKKYEPELNTFFESIGIEVKVRDENGYAYLSQSTNDELDYETKQIIKQKTGFMTIDRLIRIEALSDEQALLCILLRERLEENEIIIRKEIYILLKDFYKEVLDKAKQYKEFDNVIRQMLRLNFLTQLKIEDDEMESIFKIEKILTDKIDIDKIDEIKNKLIEKYATV
jgi:hypothetical protein